MNFKKIKNYLISNPRIKEIRMLLLFVITLIILIIMLFNLKKIFDDFVASLLNFLDELNKFLESSN